MKQLNQAAEEARRRQRMTTKIPKSPSGAGYEKHGWRSSRFGINKTVTSMQEGKDYEPGKHPVKWRDPGSSSTADEIRSWWQRATEQHRSSPRQRTNCLDIDGSQGEETLSEKLHVPDRYGERAAGAGTIS